MQVDRTKKETNKAYYKKNKETILEGKKQYYENNIDHIKETNKQYKDNNKEYYRTKFKCICKGCYTRDHKAKHFKTKKHINYMTKHDDIIKKVNDLIISIYQIKLICSINYSNI
jgi:hypothetical protein